MDKRLFDIWNIFSLCILFPVVKRYLVLHIYCGIFFYLIMLLFLTTFTDIRSDTVRLAQPRTVIISFTFEHHYDMNVCLRPIGTNAIWTLVCLGLPPRKQGNCEKRYWKNCWIYNNCQSVCLYRESSLALCNILSLGLFLLCIRHLIIIINKSHQNTKQKR